MTPTIFLTIEHPRHGYDERKIATKALGYRVATKFQRVVTNVLMKIIGNPFVPLDFSRNPKTSAYYRGTIIKFNVFKETLDRVEINRLTREEMGSIREDLMALPGVHQVEETPYSDRIGQYAISYKTSMAEETINEIESIVSLCLRLANRPWSAPPRLEVTAIQSAPAGYTAHLAAQALPYVQEPPTGRSWSERVTNKSGGHGKPTTVNPPADKEALSKFINDAIIKQCNNTTLQNTKTMLRNTTVVDELQLEIVKMKKKEVNLQNQIDEMNLMHPRVDALERQQKTDGSAIHELYTEHAILNETMDQMITEMDTLETTMTKIQVRQETLHEELASRITAEAKQRDTVRDEAAAARAERQDKDAQERDARDARARDNEAIARASSDAMLAAMMSQLVALNQGSVTSRRQDTVTQSPREGDKGNKRTIEAMQGSVVSPNGKDTRTAIDIDDDAYSHPVDYNPQK